MHKCPEMKRWAPGTSKWTDTAEHNRQTDRQTDRQMNRQTDRQTDGHTDRQTNRQTECVKHRKHYVRMYVATQILLQHCYTCKFELIHYNQNMYKAILNNLDTTNLYAAA